MRQWMNRLAEQHRRMREMYPLDNLAFVFDIDDTILDVRHMIMQVLRSFDRRNGTRYFYDLTLRDIRAGEMEVHRTLEGLQIPQIEQPHIMDWFKGRCWSPAVIRDGHRPFPGAIEVIRWLQLQPRTLVGLNTGRPECVRRETLQCLHKIGRPHGVTFPDNLLYMNLYGWGKRIIESKVEGIRHFQDLGCRVAAFIDNEPENLQAVGEFDLAGEILLLHADTLFLGDRANIPTHAVSGRIYDVAELDGMDAAATNYYRAA